MFWNRRTIGRLADTKNGMVLGMVKCENNCIKGKSPTKLIFDADIFLQDIDQNEVGDIEQGYILPKKVELLELDSSKDFVLDEAKKISYKKFRLSSDAVLKSVIEYIGVDLTTHDMKINNPFGFKCKSDCIQCEIERRTGKTSFSELSKIVIAEGYYE